mgnify:CR=1 FL=1
MFPGIKVTNWADCSAVERERLLRRPVFDNTGQAAAVAAIIARVRDGGDRALAELTAELDGSAPGALEVSSAGLDTALERSDPELREAIEDAAGRIRAFHAADRPADGRVETAPGLVCEVRYQALDPVGLYIPGGSAPLVSTVMMLAIPASLAGCKNIVMCSPPGPDGRIADEVLAAARLCGVTRVFVAGGAQAIAAMAYGTESVPRCAKVFGPGNTWVTEAKQQVSQDPQGAAIDMPAGPSEVLVIADASANAEHVAWDLMSQAEHGPDSQAILVTDSAALAEAVVERVATLAPESTLAAILEQSLAASRILVVEDTDEAVELSNDYAPEHLILNTANAEDLAGRVRNAGSVFVGAWTPESLGDYCSGTNHVLPTYGFARTFSGLGVDDFERRITVQTVTPEGLRHIGPVAAMLAEVEGLDAHARAVTLRLADLADQEVA